MLPEELLPLTKTDLWECQQKFSHDRYRLSLELKLVSILQLLRAGNNLIL